MRVLVHPPIEDITLEAVLYALSDPVRLQIFRDLEEAPIAQACSAFLSVSGAEVPKSTLSQHFRILREHGLIRSERRGVEMLSVTRAKELDKKFPGLLRAIMNAAEITD